MSHLSAKDRWNKLKTLVLKGNEPHPRILSKRRDGSDNDGKAKSYSESGTTSKYLNMPGATTYEFINYVYDPNISEKDNALMYLILCAIKKEDKPFFTANVESKHKDLKITGAIRDVSSILKKDILKRCRNDDENYNKAVRNLPDDILNEIIYVNLARVSLHDVGSCGENTTSAFIKIALLFCNEENNQQLEEFIDDNDFFYIYDIASEHAYGCTQKKDMKFFQIQTDYQNFIEMPRYLING